MTGRSSDGPGSVTPDPSLPAKALIEKLDEALRRTLAASPACPYCETPTYLRRHHDGCGIKHVLADAKAWLEAEP